jgi:AcrR family transcriptional regulator
MARKAVPQELSRERILDGARQLFISCGYRTLTMRSIAKALGYSHGALYYHFSEKAELFYALIKEDFSELRYRQRKLIESADSINMELIHTIMLEFIKFGLEYRYQYELMFMMNNIELEPYSRSEQAQCFDLFATVVSEVMNNRNGYDEKLFTLPWNLFMSLHGFISYSISFGQTYEEVRTLAEAHVNMLSNAMLVYQQQRSIPMPLELHIIA